MISQIKHIEDLTVIHWFLAYGALMVNIILKLSEIKGSFFLGIRRQEVLSTIASSILIPIVLIICTDSAMKEMLPINYVTAFLVGWNTQSFTSIITKIGKHGKS